MRFKEEKCPGEGFNHVFLQTWEEKNPTLYPFIIPYLTSLPPLPPSGLRSWISQLT